MFETGYHSMEQYYIGLMQTMLHGLSYDNETRYAVNRALMRLPND